ncbi:MAG: ROK family protein [Chloroflexota bacterium]|nr:ROK family protein [Chloroflexota bacterium]
MTTRTRTGDQALVREINLSIILNALRDRSPLSRASLAGATGLNKTTVSSLVQQLIDGRFVSEVGVEKSDEIGRPGRLLELNPAAGCIIGAEIGVDFISVLVTDFAAQVLWRRQEQTARGSAQEAILSRTLALIGAAIDHTAGGGDTVLGLGLGVPGLVDVASGTLLFGPNLGWRNVPLRAQLAAAFSFPVYVDNEANMATLGENYFGVARGAKSVLYVSAGVGLGGGIVLDGRVLPGAVGFAGEVGHMTMEPDGRPCNCGNRGCWETLVSQEAVFRRVRTAIMGGEVSSVMAATGGDLVALTVPLVAEAARNGDAVAQAALHETAVWLGVGLANLINALNPEIIVFGGILSLASDCLLPIVNDVIRERALRWPAAATQVLVAAYGADACVMGGIATVYHQILSQPFRTERMPGRPAPGMGYPVSARVGSGPLIAQP